jgi:large subunit ribosomal protein L29
MIVGKRVVKLMKVNEIRQLTDVELDSKLLDLKNELFNLRFQLATGQLDNPMRIKAVRKDIARVKTIIRERELGIGKEV